MSKPALVLRHQVAKASQKLCEAQNDTIVQRSSQSSEEAWRSILPGKFANRQDVGFIAEDNLYAMHHKSLVVESVSLAFLHYSTVL